MLLLLLACTGAPSSDDSAATDDSEQQETDSPDDSGCAALESCNGLDDDCDGSPHPEEVDADGDGELDCLACDAAGFWGSTLGLEDEALATSLGTLTAEQDCSSYSTTTTWMFTELDNDDGLVECVYTGRQVAVEDEKPESDDMNTEHTWPQSQGAGEVPAKCDLHHLYPTDAEANQVRSSWPLGEVVSAEAWSSGGSRQGLDADGDEVFEPRDEHKGDAARSLLYFAFRYGYSLDDDYEALLQGWHQDDPPGEAELERSLAIRDRQGAANPLVVCPQLVERL